MSIQCNTKQIEFLPFKSLETSGNSPGSKRTRRVIAKFDSDKVSSDGGATLLREAEHRFGVIRRFAECFIDHRNPNYITPPCAPYYRTIKRQNVFQRGKKEEKL